MSEEKKYFPSYSDKKIYFNFNGMECYYYEHNLSNPFEMKRLSDELIEFTKMFFDNGKVDWRDVTDEKDIYNYFLESNYLHNDFFNKVKLLIEEKHLKGESCSVGEALKVINDGEE